jgi:hypothetical protein
MFANTSYNSAEFLESFWRDAFSGEMAQLHDRLLFHIIEVMDEREPAADCLEDYILMWRCVLLHHAARNCWLDYYPDEMGCLMATGDTLLELVVLEVDK